MYKNSVIMGDTTEYYSDPSQRNMETKLVTWGGVEVSVHAKMNAHAMDSVYQTT
jgi:hypothetical protein